MKTTKEKEILRMQIRLFRLACRKWKKTNLECAEIFDAYRIDQYIEDAYEIFHVQGDEANLSEITDHLRRRGISL